MNKWMFTYVNTVVYLFIMLLYARLLSYSTGRIQVSNDIKLNMKMVRTRTVEEMNCDSPEGSLARGSGQVPRGSVPPPPPSPPVSLEQLLAT
jgi:hypothetical protein